MTPHDHADPLLDALQGLRDLDVSGARARRLRARCQARLQRQAITSAPRSPEPTRSERTVRLLAGAWCCVYLFETIRLAVAVYGPG